MTQINADQWITLSEASALTGRSMDYFRTQIRRHKLTQVKKVKGKRGDEWVINREAVHDLGQADQARQINADQPDQQPGQMITLPMEFYAEQLKERDQALQGLMMYRYKFEEMERQVRLLPAPVEVVTSKLTEMEQKLSELDEKELALTYSQETIKALEEALQRERQRSWWDRLWKR